MAYAPLALEVHILKPAFSQFTQVYRHFRLLIDKLKKVPAR